MDPVIAELLEAQPTAKKRAKAIQRALLDGSVAPRALTEAMAAADASQHAALIEGLEGATRVRPDLVDAALFSSLAGALWADSPSVKREAARTLANVAAHHAHDLSQAVPALLENTEHESTVVRWATAQAIAAFMRAGTDLEDHVARIVATEADGGVRGVYERALAK